MLTINTDRLCIMPLNQENLELCIDDHDKMESSFNLNISGKHPDERQKNVWRIRLNGVKADPANYMWKTVWIMVLKAENRIVGTMMLKGCPNEKGEVIVGYVVDEEYRCNGYMTEALKGIAKWMFLNPDVQCMVADTLKTNVPSQKVLKKIGMTCYKEDDECFWWRLERQQGRNVL